MKDRRFRFTQAPEWLREQYGIEISAEALRQRAHRGTLRTYKLGGTVFVAESDLRRALEGEPAA